MKKIYNKEQHEVIEMYDDYTDLTKGIYFEIQEYKDCFYDELPEETYNEDWISVLFYPIDCDPGSWDIEMDTIVSKFIDDYDNYEEVSPTQFIFQGNKKDLKETLSNKIFKKIK